MHPRTPVLALAAALLGAALPLPPTAVSAGETPSPGRPLAIAEPDGTLAHAELAGPEFREPELFHGFDDFHHPRIARLRREYALPRVLAGERDEFRRLLLLRHWVHTRWPIDNNQTFGGDAFAILEMARTGAGFHCSHSMTVQHAVLTAMGYVARNLGVDRHHEDFGRSIHHGVNEVWSNAHARWVLVDAKYDIHFERDGLPLSALDLHEAVRRDGGRGIIKVRGPERRPVPMEEPNAPEASVRGYWWVSYYLRPAPFTAPHWSGNNRVAVYDNEFFRHGTWMRSSTEGLVPHWAYRAGAFVRVPNRHELEWTPGVPQLRVRREGQRALSVELASATPNFQGYETRHDGGAWRPLTGETVRWALHGGENRLGVRTRNLFGVTGPEVEARVTAL